MVSKPKVLSKRYLGPVLVVILLVSSLIPQSVHAEPLIGFYKLGNVQWIWVNGTRFDLNVCDDKIRLKQFVAEGLHTMNSPVPIPQGYILLDQVTLEALTVGMKCSVLQKFNKWLN